MKKRFIISIVLFVLHTSVVFAQAEQDEELSKKISHMLIVGYDKDAIDFAKQGKISGFIFYKHNIKSPSDISSKINLLNESSLHSLSMFMMLDQEGGKVSRINKDNGFLYYPDAKTIAEQRGANSAKRIYDNMAKSLASVGFNFNLGPCVDLHKHPKSFIAGNKRSYGKDAKTVTSFAKIFIDSHNKYGVITALKHYPGLGSAVLDSHTDIVDLTDTWQKDENIPYHEIIKEFPFQPVLVGHAYNKNYDTKDISSLSPKIIGRLEKDNGHKGIVIMDAADMAGAKKYSSEDIIIKGINAGVDIFLYPNHGGKETGNNNYMSPDNFQAIVLKAIRENKINPETINNSYKKIISLKKNLK